MENAIIVMENPMLILLRSTLSHRRMPVVTTLGVVARLESVLINKLAEQENHTLNIKQENKLNHKNANVV